LKILPMRAAAVLCILLHSSGVKKSRRTLLRVIGFRDPCF